jgi:hypothetical protein
MLIPIAPRTKAGFEKLEAERKSHGSRFCLLRIRIDSFCSSALALLRLTGLPESYSVSISLRFAPTPPAVGTRELASVAMRSDHHGIG